MEANRKIALLLFMSAILLSSLVPGGPIENRDFSHISTSVLMGFNLLLTVLGLGSFGLAVKWFKSPGKPYWPLAAGTGYALVYGLDLLQLFPQSPTPMNPALWAIEVTGLILSLPLITLAVINFNAHSPDHQAKLALWQWLTLSGLATVVVVFSTHAAMGG